MVAEEVVYGIPPTESVKEARERRVSNIFNHLDWTHLGWVHKDGFGIVVSGSGRQAIDTGFHYDLVVECFEMLGWLERDYSFIRRMPEAAVTDRFTPPEPDIAEVTRLVGYIIHLKPYFDNETILRFLFGGIDEETAMRIHENDIDDNIVFHLADE